MSLPRPQCLAVPVWRPAWRTAARTLLAQRGELEHLVARVPVRSLPPGHSAAGEVLNWLGLRYAAGLLAYQPDPDEYDRWCSPSITLEAGFGDCDDLALAAAKLLGELGAEARLTVGLYFNGTEWGRHAWVEGKDELRWFLLEATPAPRLYRARPAGYHVEDYVGEAPGPRAGRVALDVLEELANFVALKPVVREVEMQRRARRLAARAFLVRGFQAARGGLW